MISTCFFLICFVLLFLAIFFLKKSENKILLIRGGILSIVFIMTYSAVVVMIFQILGIAISPVSLGVLYAITATVVGIYIFKRKQVQKIEIDKIELIGFIILSIVFLMIELKVFSWSLRHSFNNEVDPANHFKMAMNIVRNGKVSGMYFSALFNSCIINMCKPFLAEIKLYKAFILGNTLQNYICLIFFYVLVFKFAKNEKTKIAAIIITLLYWFGYPLYSYIGGNFVYWEAGVLLIEYLIFVLYELLEGKSKTIPCIVAIAFGLYSLAVCYIMFAPAAFIGAFVVFLLFLVKRGIPVKKIVVGCSVLITIGILGVLFCYYMIFSSKGLQVGKTLTLQGGIYSEVYRDFLFLVPPVLYVCIKDIKRKNWSVFHIFLLSFVGVTGVMFVMRLFGAISTYYYFKNYYALWMLFWIGVMLLSAQIRKEEITYWIAYSSIIVLSAIMCFGKVEEKFYYVEDVEEVKNYKELLGIYEYNIELLKKDYETEKYSDEKFEIMQYVIDNLSGKDTPTVFLMTSNCKGDCYWYEAITQQDSKAFYSSRWKNENLELLESALKENDIQYFVILKSSQAYNRYPEYFEKYEWIFENEEGIIAKVY